MTVILVASGAGCRVFADTGERDIEMAGRPVFALAPEPDGGCLAVVDQKEIWRRSGGGEWSTVATCAGSVECIASVSGTIYVGSGDEAAVYRCGSGGTLAGRDTGGTPAVRRLAGFDATPGRSTWFAGGPPLTLRSLAGSPDGGVILAVPHVGGIPRSTDGGETWLPTVPVLHDVHEVRFHPSRGDLAAAAAAVGLCVSEDAGLTWRVLSEGIEGTTSLALAVLEDEVLFSVQDSPFATRSQLWRWRIGTDRVEPVRDGLPEWLDGKLDTGHIAAGSGRAALVDGGGNVWVSTTGSRGWRRVADGVAYAFGVAIV